MTNKGGTPHKSMRNIARRIDSIHHHNQGATKCQS